MGFGVRHGMSRAALGFLRDVELARLCSLRTMRVPPHPPPRPHRPTSLAISSLLSLAPSAPRFRSQLLGCSALLQSSEVSVCWGKVTMPWM